MRTDYSGTDRRQPQPWWIDDDSCLAYLFHQRYHQAICEYCGHAGRFYRHRTKRCYTCACGSSHFYPAKGTVFECSPLPLSKWFGAVWLLANSPKKLNAAELARSIRVSYVTAWRMIHLLRERIPQRGECTFERLLKNCLDGDSQRS